MKKQNSVMGIIATSPKPDWRGFLLLGLIFGGPVLVVQFVIGAVF